jgi:hypothetical protein
VGAITEAVQWLREREQRIKGDVVEFAETHLPALEAWVEKAEANPVVAAILKAEHLSPTFLSAMASAIEEAEAELAKLQPAAPQPDPAAVPAEQAS